MKPEPMTSCPPDVSDRFTLVYLDSERRVRIWLEGGMQQERSNTPFMEQPSWRTANGEDWSLDDGVIARIRTATTEIVRPHPSSYYRTAGA